MEGSNAVSGALQSESETSDKGQIKIDKKQKSTALNTNQRLDCSIWKRSRTKVCLLQQILKNVATNVNRINEYVRI